jgi:hypothetical protein
MKKDLLKTLIEVVVDLGYDKKWFTKNDLEQALKERNFEAIDINAIFELLNDVLAENNGLYHIDLSKAFYSVYCRNR